MNAAQRRTWEEERKFYIGASEAPAALNYDPYLSPHGLWQLKKGLSTRIETIAMRRGHAMEPFLRKEYFIKEGVRIRRSTTYKHPRYQFLGCNPDGEVARRFVKGGPMLKGFVELKDASYWAAKKYGPEGTGMVEERHLIQAIVQLAIGVHYGIQFVELFACLDGNEVILNRYAFDPELSQVAEVFEAERVKAVLTRLINWWQTHIVNDNEPRLTYHESDAEWAQEQRATYENGEMTNPTPEIAHVCHQHRKAYLRHKRAGKLKDASANVIRQFLIQEKASVLDSELGKYTYKLDANRVGVLRVPYSREKLQESEQE